MSIPGLLDGIGLFADEELVEAWEDRFIAVDFDFATLLSSPLCSCILSAIVLEQLIKLEFWAQQVELKWLMLNKWRRWFHSSRVDFPLVNMSASWCLVSMWRIWILGSKLILSNNQSRATLWVLDPCLIVGLLPLIIILITASLSSKTYNMAPGPECVVFDGMWSMFVGIAWLKSCFACVAWQLPTGFHVVLSWVHLFCLVRNEILQSLNPREWEREYRPCVTLHREKWFQILLNCAKLKSVSCTSNLLAQTCDFQKCTMFLQKWILSPQDFPQNRSLETVPVLHCLAVFPTWQFCLYSHVWWM